MTQSHIEDNEVPGANSIFPGFYREKDHPGNVGYVTKVTKGLVCWEGTKGTTRSALMGSLDFMTRYERVL